jgi:uncharacterized oxidoreductase
MMEMTGNTILITGGSSGIGMELARQLAKDNVVIITGRNRAKLDSAKAELGNVHAIQSDAGDPNAILELYETLTHEFPALNVLVNNAGIMRKISLRDGADDLTDVVREIDINLNGPIRMVAQFLPHLRKQKSPVIINVSSGLAFVPFPLSPIYSAAKAGIHAFTQALRFQLKRTNVKVFELAPPGTETPLFRGEFDEQDLGSASGMDVRKLAALAISAMKKDRLEIRPGLSNVLKLLSRLTPGFAVNLVGQTASASLDRIAHAASTKSPGGRSAGHLTRSS